MVDSTRNMVTVDTEVQEKIDMDQPVHSAADIYYDSVLALIILRDKYAPGVGIRKISRPVFNHPLESFYLAHIKYITTLNSTRKLKNSYI